MHLLLTVMGADEASSNLHHPKDPSIDAKGQKESHNSTRAEYFVNLEKWLNSFYVYQSLRATQPYFLLYNQFNSVSNGGFLPWPTNNLNITRQFQTAASGYLNTPSAQQGLQCHIPPLWKRLAAELLDFFVLFFVKVVITFVVVDSFDLIDLNKFDLEIIQKDLKYDNQAAMQVLYEIVLLEGIHRIVVCLFETFWLQSEIGQRLGGATPGKSLLGLRVVACDRITPVQGDEVIVYPGKNLTVARAFYRSSMKNLVHAIFIPASLGFLYFQFNRFGYDVLCGTVVIEDSPSIRDRLQPR